MGTSLILVCMCTSVSNEDPKDDGRYSPTTDTNMSLPPSRWRTRMSSSVSALVCNNGAISVSTRRVSNIVTSSPEGGERGVYI